MHDVTLIGLKDAAPLIGKHYVVALNMVYKGQLKAIKKGGRWYVSQDEVNRFNREGNYVEKVSEADA